MTSVLITDEWTEERSISLIRAFRVRPQLWDTKHPFYFRKRKKLVAWAEIGQLMNAKPEVCKHKMGILMSSFRREKAKISQCHARDKVYQSVWFGFKELTFLFDKENERRRQRMGVPLFEELDEAELALQLENANALASCTSSSLTPVPTVPSTVGPIIKTVPPPVQEEPIRINPSTTLAADVSIAKRETEDEIIKSFTCFIASKMKRYSEVTKNAVQQAICDIIFKADQQLYEKDGTSGNSSPSVPTTTSVLPMLNSDLDMIIKDEQINEVQ